MTMQNVLEWVPAGGHQLRKAGVYFDAIRVAGLRGEAVTYSLREAVGDEPGPVVREVTGHRWTYFLLAPGSSRLYRWPYAVTRFGAGRFDAYVGVPALGGETWPLLWECPPPADGRFVDAEVLYRILCTQLGAR